MNRTWTRWMVTHRWIVIAIILAITIVSAIGFKHLYFYNRMTSWLPKSDPQISLYVRTSEKYSTNELVLILVRPKEGIFCRDTLARVRRLTDFLANREEIFSVTSLTNTVDIRKIPGGIEVKNLLEETPDTVAEMTALKEYVLGSEMFRNRVISADGQWLAFSVSFREKFEVIRTAGDIVIPETEKIFGGHGDVYFTGTPTDGYFVGHYIQKDMVTLVPIMLLLIIVILYFSFRTLKGILHPLLVVILANVWLFGLIGYLRKPLTIIMPAIPVLIMALGSAYALYVINKLQHDWSDSVPDKKKLIIASIASVITPILFAAVTDIIGFFSFKSARLSLIADFGFFSAIGLIFAVIISLSLIPALATFSSFKTKKKIETHHFHRFLEHSGNLVIGHPKATLLVSLLLLVAIGPFMLRLKKEVSFAELYPANSQPRKAIDCANRYFEGSYPISVIIGAGNVKRPEVLRLARRLESFLYSLPSTATPISIVDLVSELNYQLGDSYMLPESSKAIANLWFFVEGRSELGQILAKDETETVILTRVSDPTTTANSKLSKKITSFIASEQKKKYASYRLSDLSEAAAETVRRDEAACLAEEILWMSSRFGGSDLNPARLAAWLQKEAKSPLPEAPARDALALAWRQYLGSSSFEFALSPASVEAIASELSALWPRGGGEMPEKDIAALFKGHVPLSEYDEGLAASAAASLRFTALETIHRLRVEKLVSALAGTLPAGTEQFRKGVQSVLYDLTDDLAVIPKNRSLATGESFGLRSLSYTGSPVLLTKLGDFLFESLIQSILLAYFITLMMMMIMRRSVPLGVISTIPIVFTSAFMYGFLGLLKLPLDYASMMIGAISIGVGIDYTIHFIYVATDNFRNGQSLEGAIKGAFLERGKVIISNSITVMAGFGVLMLSSLRVLAKFGINMVFAMLIASIAALTMLPAAILVFRPKLKVLPIQDSKEA